MKPKFSTLIILTVVCVVLLSPFALSKLYLPALRNHAFDIHQFFQNDLYKQLTGYLSLAFVLLEMVLTVRKRSRGWKVKFAVPGSIQFWRSLHIFMGVALLGTTLVHTVGSNGLNFNAVFLWVFFGVTLSALVGVVTETGIIESPRRYFDWRRKQVEAGEAKLSLGIPKGQLIRGWRSWWLTTHIFLVSVFFVMLCVHIFLAYYYQ